MAAVRFHRGHAYLCWVQFQGWYGKEMQLFSKENEPWPWAEPMVLSLALVSAAASRNVTYMHPSCVDFIRNCHFWEYLDIVIVTHMT